MAKAGFTKVHHIIDGFEGGKVEDPESLHRGMRMENGWKNAVPWTSKLDPKLVWLPSEGELEILSKPWICSHDPDLLDRIAPRRPLRAYTAQTGHPPVCAGGIWAHAADPPSVRKAPGPT